MELSEVRGGSGGPKDTRGTVAFVSEFQHTHGTWVLVEGGMVERALLQFAPLGKGPEPGAVAGAAV